MSNQTSNNTNPLQEKIEKALDISNLPIEKQQEIVVRIGTILYQNVIMRITERMTDEELDEFEKFFDNNPKPNEIFDFLKSKAADLETIINEEAKKFGDHTKNIMDQIGK